MSSLPPQLEHWNKLPPDRAAAAILPCNGSQAWAGKLAAARPFSSGESLLETADKIWQHLPAPDWQQAFDSHPRIGESRAKSASAASLGMSAHEQSAANPDEETRVALAQANRVYEAKFGRIFLVCATGKSGAEMLAILNRRLANDPETELREAVEQQRQITRLRLAKWLQNQPEAS